MLGFNTDEYIETTGKITAVTECPRTADENQQYDIEFTYTAGGKEYESTFNNLEGSYKNVNPNNGTKNGWQYIKASNVNELKVGDIVRIGKSNSNGHSGVVLTVSNGKCTFAQVFGGVNNKISIGTSLASSSFGTHSTLKSMKDKGVLLYVYRFVG